jgi:type II secretion system protein H
MKLPAPSKHEPRRQRSPGLFLDLSRGSRGFTLVELLIVIVLLGIAAQIVIPAFSSDVPRAAVKTEAEKLAVKLNFLRSETRLRARQYGIELDLSEQRYRVRLPKEFRVVDEENADYEDRDELETLAWYEFPETVKLLLVDQGAGAIESSGTQEILFDPSGRTDTKLLVLGHAFQEGIEFSVTVPGLAGQVMVEEGRQTLPTANDYDF